MFKDLSILIDKGNPQKFGNFEFLSRFGQDPDPDPLLVFGSDPDPDP